MKRINARVVLIALTVWLLIVVVGTAWAIYVSHGDTSSAGFSTMEFIRNNVIVAIVPLLVRILCLRIAGGVPLRFVLIGWLIVGAALLVSARYVALAIGYVYLFILFAAGIAISLPSSVAAIVAAVLNILFCLSLAHGLAYLVGHQVMYLRGFRAG